MRRTRDGEVEGTGRDGTGTRRDGGEAGRDGGRGGTGRDGGEADAMRITPGWGLLEVRGGSGCAMLTLDDVL